MRPFVHVNCAMSADGKIAGVDRKQVRISSQEDKERVKSLRMKYESILVGVGTVLSDDPHLTVKGLDYDTNPIRIVIDPNGKTPDEALVLNESAPTVIVTTIGNERDWDCEEIVSIGKEIDLKKVLEHLYDEIGIESILVEGGGETISHFFKEGLVDTYTVYVGDFIIGGRSAPTPVDGDGWVHPDGLRMRLESIERMGEGALLTYICNNDS